MAAAMQSNLKPAKSPSTLGVPVMFASKTVFGGSGAVSSTTGDQGIKVSYKSMGTGKYIAYFPSLRAVRHASVQLTNATAANRTAMITAVSADTSGYCTVSFTTMSAGSAADATSGDEIYVAVWGDA